MSGLGKTPAQRFHDFLKKGDMVPNPEQILGNLATPDQKQLYRQVRTLYDRLLCDIGDAVVKPDLTKNPFFVALAAPRKSK